MKVFYLSRFFQKETYYKIKDAQRQKAHKDEVRQIQDLQNVKQTNIQTKKP